MCTYFERTVFVKALKNFLQERYQASRSSVNFARILKNTLPLYFILAVLRV